MAKWSKKIEREMMDAIAMVMKPQQCALIATPPEHDVMSDLRAAHAMVSDCIGKEDSYMEGMQPARMWLDDVEIPIQSFNPGGFIPKGSLFERLLISEVDRQSESIEKMDSILRDAPIEKPKMLTHFGRVMHGDEERIVLYPFVNETDGSQTARDALGFTIDQARALYDGLEAELMAAERLAQYQE